ncbi:MAG: PAS domain-containing protein [Pirellulales bacterium]|nr:PAS domain-containing protein [Pirellulales bacterium]
MSAQRLKPLDPSRLFQATTLPVCLLDDESRLAYVNPAFEAWCGCPAEQLLGTPCQFHVPLEATRAQLVAASLAPPPDLGSHQTIARPIVRPTGSETSTSYRATFLRLGENVAEGSALLVVLHAVDAGETAENATNAEADLHAELLRFRARHQGRYRLDLTVGHSPAARRLRAQLDVATSSSAHAIILGSEGSGRRGLARAISMGRDGQQRGPLPVLDAPSATPDTWNAALSSFTRTTPADSATSRPTFLVSDIDRLPAELQGEFWRWLRGSGATARILATARQSLVETARAGQYHVELAHALSTIEIPLVALGERREDIPLLAQALLEELNGRATRQHTGFSPEALDLLSAYAWPGGYAELSELVARAHEQAEGAVVTSRDLDDRVRLGHVARRRETEPIVLDRFMTEIEKEVVSRALRMAKGNKARAARLLGLTRPRLYRRMEQLGLGDSAPSA